MLPCAKERLAEQTHEPRASSLTQVASRHRFDGGTGSDGRHRLPLVLTLHGSQSDANEQCLRRTAVSGRTLRLVLASAQGYVPAAPGYRWNVPGVTLPPGQPPNDEQFLTDLIDQLESTLCLDARRVYGTGYSGGARMNSQYACDHPDRVAAIAAVAGLRAGVAISGPNGPEPDPATCAPTRPVPVITFPEPPTRSIPTPVAGRRIGSTA